MKIVSVYFEVNDEGIYEKLMKMFQFSIKKNMPDAILEIKRLPNPIIEHRRFQHQIIKQRAWTALALEQTEPYIMMDCDMLVTGNLFEAFREEFDIGITTRDKERKPLNGGMIFCRPTVSAKKFWQEWLNYCEMAYADPQIWRNFNSKCKGFAQSALWHLIQNNNYCDILGFPCQEWNACDEEWEYADGSTKAWHLKGAMRKALFKGHSIPSQHFYKLWNQYERECDGSDQEHRGTNGRIVPVYSK